MKWLVLTYTLPSGGTSSARVALWRRLKRLGAQPLTGANAILPDQPHCRESFQWLAQEVRQAEGEALVLHVESLAGLSNRALIERFNAARAAEAAELQAALSEVEATLGAGLTEPVYAVATAALERVRKRATDLQRIDFFGSPEGRALHTRLTQVARRLSPPEATTSVPTVRLAAYQARTWATRPQPYVDRLASAWLIRRFIDPAAAIRYTDAPDPGDVTFDTPDGHFTHTGDLCTFETLLRAFDLNEPPLAALAEIVHDLDLRDARYARPETPGVEALLDGWTALNLQDEELEAHGRLLFDGLYATAQTQHQHTQSAH